MSSEASAPKLRVVPLEESVSLQSRAYEAIKRAITDMDIYGGKDEIRLDERQLSMDLRVSRTPIRGAMTLLEQEGFVRSIPRRGTFVVRKTKAEIVEMITVWAALESMAARLAASRATRAELKRLRAMFDTFDGEGPEAHVDEYSETNIAFHQELIRLGGSRLIVELTTNLLLHVRAIRALTIRQNHRAEKSIREHRAIIDALEAGDAERAERLVRDHTLDLAEHVRRNVEIPE